MLLYIHSYYEGRVMTQEPDWKTVLVDIGNRLRDELKSERTTKDSLAQQIGYDIVRDSKADTSGSAARIKQIDAKIEGLNSGIMLVSGYLNGTYKLPDKP